MNYNLSIYVYKVGGSPQSGVQATLFLRRSTTGVWYRVGPVSTSSTGRAAFLGYMNYPYYDLSYHMLDYETWHYVSDMYVPDREYTFTHTVGEPSPPRENTTLSIAVEGLSKVSGYLTSASGIGLDGRWIDLYIDGSYTEGVITRNGGYYDFYPILTGSHTFETRFAGDAWYNACEGKGGLPLSATLSASPTSGLVPLAVTFTIGITGGVTPYTWTLDYGDGSTPDSGTVAGTKAHTYTTVGTFTATLTVTDALGASVFSRGVTYAGVLPIPDIVSLISGLAPLIAVASVVAASELQRIHIFG